MRVRILCSLAIALLSPIPLATAWASGLSDITGINIDIPAGNVTFGPPRIDRLPAVIQALPRDAATFFANPFLGGTLALAIRQAKAQARQNCVPMPPDVTVKLSSFFPPGLFDSVCWAVVADGASLAGYAIRDFNQAAVTFEDVTVFRSVLDGHNAVLWSHELTHVLQYKRLGIEGFAAIYAGGGFDALEQEARLFDQFVAARLQAANRQYWQTANGWSVNQQITFPQYAVAARQVMQTWHGVDLDSYCRSKGHRAVALVENNAYGWKCVAQSGANLPIDMFDVCRWQYRGSWPRPIFTDFNNAGSWTCTAP
jgi:Domain of unknown function (DUF4157)